MKFSKFFKIQLSKQIFWLFFAFLFCNIGFAQEETPSDSTKTGYDLGNIQMPNPESIQSKYTYDPILDRYIYSEKIDDINTIYPLVLTREEYQKLVLRERMMAYFKQKSDVVKGRNDDAQDDLLPIFYVNNDFFETIFGGNQIEVNPQGSVGIDMGILYSKQDNPTLSPRNQSNLSFDFNQAIRLSLQAKVGTRLTVDAQFDTESTFDFQNQIKLQYTPNEDDILQDIQIGNVNMPLNSSLIQGSQSLFGVKTKFKFGKTTITSVFSEMNSERQNVSVEGGGTVREYDKFILDYDENRHFFLAQFFRDEYDRALQNYPFINSRVQIQRVQIWVTNRTNNPQTIANARNIVAIQDLGESEPDKLGFFLDDNGNQISPPLPNFLNNPGNFPDNPNNDFNPFGIGSGSNSVLTEQIREIATVGQGFGAASSFVQEGRDYGVLENARELQPNEYTLNRELGYITLNQRLSNDEILGVAFQFTTNGQVFQVGEFANDGIDASQNIQNPDQQDQQIAQNQALVVKMLKSPVTNVNEPIWDLMMKNFYNLNGSNLEQEGFKMNILYTDPQPLNFINPAPGGSLALPDDVAEENLLNVFELDQLNANQDPISTGDGFFDFVPGITIDTQNGVIKFTKVEPFGEFLFNKLDNTPNTGPEDYDDPTTYNDNQDFYVFRSLYTTTKTQALQNEAQKNKFQIKGRYKSSGQDGIPLGALNVPRGSVTVTAGGRTLQEGVDYVVDYELGRVQILDDALLASNTPIQVSTENNALFGRQTKRFTGIDVQHQFSDKLLLGATFLNLNERPLTQKADFNQEPINNTIYGFNFNYNSEVPFLTRLVNKLPNIDTDVPSNLSLRGEFAYLSPGSPNADDFNGETTSYVDDFEGSQTSISLLNPDPWELSSVPVGFRGPNDVNGSFDANNELSINDFRAKLNWYSIDPIFYSTQRPAAISDQDLSDYKTRRVLINELFPNTDIVTGQIQTIFTLDLSFDPTRRGMFNYNSAASNDNTLPNPQQNFGGIMRGLQTTDFERANVQFIEFWVMDPFIYTENAGNNGGQVVLNLGSMSEDILKDGRKQYENGLPEDGGEANTITTEFSKLPTEQSLVYAFDTEGQERTNQDAGFDGLNNAQEAQKFPGFSNFDDPSNDDYVYFLNRDGSITERYENFNGSQGNNITEVSQNNRGNSAFPDVEDVNRDNTMNTIDSYFEYKIPVFPNMSVDNNTSNQAGINQDYITDVRETTTTLPNGEQLPVRWVQFRVPLNTSEEFAVGGIADLRSVRFMRMYLTDFERKTHLRLGSLDLVRGDYLTYKQPILPNGTDPETNGSTTFSVQSVSEENTTEYVAPPGVVREELVNNNQSIREDEQSLALLINNLESQDSRGVFKNFRVDMRQYENLEMFLHAQATPPPAIQLQDNQMVAFIRMGLDFTNNYYQIEVPLKVSEAGDLTPRGVWPLENDLNLPLDLLQEIKSLVIGNDAFSNLELNFFNENLEPVSGTEQTEDLRIGIKGNPSFGDIRVLMLGVKNQTEQNISGQVWFNELRLSGLQNEGGWAALVNLDTNLADFATITATGRRSTVGFGNIEDGPNQRSREDVQEYDVTTGINVGQLLPKDWGIKIPFSYSRGETLITPQFDPVLRDIELETLLDNAQDEQTEDELRERAEDYTKRQSVSVIGLRKERTNTAKTPMPYDVENFTFSGTYNQIDHRDFEIKESVDQSVDVNATYNYAFPQVKVEPLKDNEFLKKSPYFDLIKDFNFNALPTSVSASSTINRQYSELQFREFNLPEGSLGLPRLFQRNYFYDWQFAIDYQLTESLNFNFSAAQNRVVRNFIDENNEQDNSVGVWTDFFNVGIPNRHSQTLQVNYNLPFDKIPFLKFINAQYSYTGNFLWQKGSEILRNLEDIPNIGNSVQNSSQHQINGNLTMATFYDYIGLKKKGQDNNTQRVNNQQSRRRRGQNQNNQTSQLQPQNTQEDDDLGFGTQLLNTGVTLLRVVDNVQFNYSESRGIFLPGYTNDVGFTGTLRPTAGFVFGGQRDVREIAARKGWLTLFQDFNEQYSRNLTEQFDMQAGLKLLPGLTIDLLANRMYMDTYTENFRIDPETLQYQSLAPNTFGNFNITTNLIKTAFQTSTADNSPAFEDFRSNRLIVARRLAREAGINPDNPDNLDDDGFPIGFGKTNQAVLLPAFLAAYTGEDASSVKLSAFRDTPIPNWNMKYTGLMRLKWFQERFNRFSIEHGYTSNYTINQFQSNLEFDRNNPFGESNKDQNGNFINNLFIGNVILSEQFTPLVKVDFEMKNSVSILAEIKRDRALSLSFNNNLMTEIQGDEYRLGLGYRVRDLRIVTKFEGNRRVLSSDLNLKADISFRRNETIIRSLDVLNSRTTAGQDIWTINFTADYGLTRNLTAAFFYDHTFSENAISTIFPQTTIRTGIRLTYNFGN
ncbi:T9SS outer membrane translocon Sov/SprA [Mesohalobacter salilacus]|uniref:T9SS outer membrane translocon Sov/SprA n=1 Tax=Mesohalobacter salilacus TaxID=2491711 RepID=UPI0026D73262